MLSIVVVENMYLDQIYVKVAFLYGDLEQMLYMEQPQGYVVLGNKFMVYMLKKI